MSLKNLFSGERLTCTLSEHGMVNLQFDNKEAPINKFDEKKLMKLIKGDKFLTYVVKKDFKGKVDKTKLEQIYFMYIVGDKDMEKKYLKTK